MKQYDVVMLGNPLLRQKAEPIYENEFGSSDLKELEQTLFHAMKAENGLGLAAPQVGISKRALVFGMDKRPVHSQRPSIPMTALFNPSYEPLSNECVTDYEGCISVGSLRCKVSRFQHILYRGYDANGQLIEREATDLHARVFQHEYDHLEGIIFLDRVSDVNSLGFHEELVRAGQLRTEEEAA